jgi:drug/metabolite transporter (DMT)-like permease
VVSVLLALAASVSWGVSDFLGGLNTRTLAVATVLFFTQAVGFVVLAPIALARGMPDWQLATVVAAMGGSISGLVGIAALYRGMAVGTVSIVAPISATGAAIPVLFGLLRGERASLVQSAGIVLALVGIVLASLVTSDEASGKKHGRLATDAGYGLLAAVGFGGFFVLLHEASVQDVFWATTIQRLTGMCLLAVIVLVMRSPVAIGWLRLSRLVIVGVLDATANVLYAFASTTGLVSLAAVLASLFPVMTVILARIVLHERLSRLQGTGVVCALAGVACIAMQ